MHVESTEPEVAVRPRAIDHVSCIRVLRSNLGGQGGKILGTERWIFPDGRPHFFVPSARYLYMTNDDIVYT